AARSSALARSVSYLTSWVRSLIASDTRSPTDRSSPTTGLAAAGSAIALSSLLRPGAGSRRQPPVRHALRGMHPPPDPAAAGPGQPPLCSGDEPPIAAILRHHQRATRPHAPRALCPPRHTP